MDRGYYRHIDGGIYFLITIAKSADTGKEDKEYAVYEHVFPFPQETYVRDKLGFALRFSPIQPDDALKFMSDHSELEARSIIQKAKSIRRLREGKGI